MGNLRFRVTSRKTDGRAAGRKVSRCSGRLFRVAPEPAEHLLVVGEFVVALGGLEDFRDVPEPRVAHDPAKRLGAEASLRDELVAIAPGIEGGLRIVQVQ